MQKQLENMEEGKETAALARERDAARKRKEEPSETSGNGIPRPHQAPSRRRPTGHWQETSPGTRKAAGIYGQGKDQMPTGSPAEETD